MARLPPPFTTHQPSTRTVTTEQTTLDLGPMPYRPPDWNPSRPASRQDAWRDLTAMAADAETDDGLMRGQLYASRSILRERWGWSDKAVRWWLHVLQRDDRIRYEPGPGRSLSTITIVGYGEGVGE